MWRSRDCRTGQQVCLPFSEVDDESFMLLILWVLCCCWLP
jgi:hypothetical protein